MVYYFMYVALLCKFTSLLIQLRETKMNKYVLFSDLIQELASLIFGVFFGSGREWLGPVLVIRGKIPKLHSLYMAKYIRPLIAHQFLVACPRPYN